MKTITLTFEIAEFPDDTKEATIYSAWVFVAVDGETVKAHHAGYEHNRIAAQIAASDEADRIARLLDAVTGIRPNIVEG